MKIDIDRFDLKNVAINPEQVFSFPGGLVGFEQHTRFSLFHEEGKPTVFWLQSLDDPAISFPVVPPELLNIEYRIELSDDDCALLGLQDAADAVVAVILYRDAAAAAGGDAVAANTRSPLVLNCRTRIGMQKLLSEVVPGVVVCGR